MFRAKRILIITLWFVSFILHDAVFAHALSDMPGTAVFFEPGFPYFGINSQVSPQALVTQLIDAGVSAKSVGENVLSDPSQFNIRKFSTLILPYGNTYPAKAFAAMREFHRAGGILILSGIPFTHPVIRNLHGKWVDEGHNSEAALFGPNGIGVGGFTGPGSDSNPSVAQNDLLGIAKLNLNWASDMQSQRLDPTTLPADDELNPIVGSAQRPVIAIHIHKAPPYAGAVDVWTHNGPAGDLEVWAAEQLMLRGTIAALKYKGLLSEFQQRIVFARLADLPKPHVYTNVILPVMPRRYKTFQPKMLKPAKHLYVADVRKCTRDERILLLSLQGIVNRRTPRIYLIFQDDDRFWLKEMQQKADTDTPIEISNPLSLVNRFRHEIHGAVLPDPNIYLSACTAASIAGADDVLIATPELAKRLHLQIKIDLRGKFREGAEALRYIRTNLLPKLNPYLSCSLDPAIFDSGALDQVIAAKGSVFWITGTKAQFLPGTNGQKETEEVKALLAALPLGALIRGFWWHGDDMGINEGPGVSLASRFGKVTIVSDYVANFLVFSGVNLERLKQRSQLPPPTLDLGKVYFSFTMSDGDNLCTWRSYFRSYFSDPLHGSIPVGWGMGPTLIDCAPVWARWYFEHSTPNDEFLCDVSGVGYIYGPDWATSLKDRGAAYKVFYNWTEKYMSRLDMKTIRLMNVGAPDIAQAAKLMPDVKFLMPDYGSSGGTPYKELTYRLEGGQTVFRAITGADGGAEKLADQIRERVGSVRPAFINVFIWNWGSKMSDLKRIIDLLGPGYIAVTPSQLNLLYRQSLLESAISKVKFSQ